MILWPANPYRVYKYYTFIRITFKLVLFIYTVTIIVDQEDK